MTTEKQISQSTLRKKIITEGLIPYICSECSNIGIWNNKSLTLELDHINGDRGNQNIENLRFLCPNCHSQQPTSNIGWKRKKKVSEEEILEAAKKYKSFRQILLSLNLRDGSANYSRLKRVLRYYGGFDHLFEDNNLMDIDVKIEMNKFRTSKQLNRPHKEKIEWPSDEELQLLINNKPISILAKDLNISDVAIHKRIKKRKLTKPQRGYWITKTGRKGREFESLTLRHFK